MWFLSQILLIYMQFFSYFQKEAWQKHILKFRILRELILVAMDLNLEQLFLLLLPILLKDSKGNVWGDVPM